MKEFLIKIESIGGNPKTEENFVYGCETAQQAWDYARDKWRLYGAMSRIKEVVQLPRLVQVANTDNGYDIIDRDRGEVIAKLAPTSWGKWKIIGEDVYAQTPRGLLYRLQLRQRMLNALVAPPLIFTGGHLTY